MSHHPIAALEAELDHALDGFKQTRSLPPLEHGRRVVAALLAHPDWPGRAPDVRARQLFLGGGITLNLHKFKRDAACLTESITLSTAALNLAEAGGFEGADDLHVNILANLAVARKNLAGVNRDGAQLREAINLMRRVVAASMNDNVRLPERVSNLGSALLTAFRAEGDSDDLKETIAAFELAYSIGPTPSLAANLGGALELRYRVTGRRSDLERAIDLARSAITMLPPDHPAQASFLNNLTIYLGARFAAEGHLPDAHEAVLAATEAVARTPEGSPYLAGRLASLGNLHGVIYQRTAVSTESAASVECLEAALEASLGAADEISRLKTNLALALTSSPTALSDAAVVDRACQLGRDALADASEQGPHYLLAMNALSEALRAKGRLTGSQDPYIEASALLERGLSATGPLTAERLKISLNLSHALLDLHVLDTQVQTLDRAAAVAGPAITGVMHVALQSGMPAMDVEHVIKLAHRLALRLITQARLLKAATFLEMSRAVRLLSDAGVAGRQPEFAQKEDGEVYEDTAKSLRRVRVLIDSAAVDPDRDQAAYAGLLAEAEALNETLVTIGARAQNPVGGHDPGSAIAHAAEQTRSAIGYVYATEEAAGVLWCFGQAYDHLPLPGLREAANQLRNGDAFVPATLAEKLANGEFDVDRLGWLPAYALAHSYTAAGSAEQYAWRCVLERVLSWLAIAFAAPVCEFLETNGVEAITLVPMGELALLPLHAALVSDTPLFSRFKIRFAPSASLLDIVASRPQADPDQRYVVADTRRDLACARIEGLAIAGANGRLDIGEAGTVGSLAEGLASAGYSHLAVHALFDTAMPLNSHICAAVDGTGADSIRLSELLSGQVPIRSGATVVASACETGVFDVVRAPSEQIGLAAALLAAGARSVAATLWPVSDLSTTLIMHRAAHLQKAMDMTVLDSIAHASAWLRVAPASDIRIAATDMLALVPADDPRFASGKAMLKRLIADFADDDTTPFAHPLHWAPFVCLGA